MTEKVRYDSTCDVVQENTGKTVKAEVMSFNEGRNLTVILNKSVKLLMSWNGRVYEGRMAGLDFVSQGPRGHKYTESTR